MSDPERLRQDLQSLTQALRDLTLATTELTDRRAGGGEVEAASSQEHTTPSRRGGWELVTDGTAIPGPPPDFLSRPVVVEFESGPPELLEFCLRLAKKNFTSSKGSAEDRAWEAFKAGFWVRAFWTCKAERSVPYKPGVSNYAHWILRKGSDFDFVRVTSQADADRLVADYPDIAQVERLPSLTELHIFCAGASIPVPPLWRWSATQ